VPGLPLTSVPARAPTAAAAPADAEEDGSFWDYFEDEEDGAFDVSDWLATKSGFLPLVTIITEPAVGFGLGGGLMFVHRPEEWAPDESGRASPPSISGVFGGATENGTWMVGGGHRGVWENDTIRYLGGVARFSAFLDFYGIRDDSPLKDRPIEMNFDGWALIQEIQFRLGDSDFFVGATYDLIDIDTGFKFPFLPPGIDQVQLSSRASGIGGVVEYDSRDNTFTPNRGLNVDLSYKQFAEAIGGDSDFSKASLHTRGWIDFDSEDVVLGLRLDIDSTAGATPLYQYSWIQQRGVPAFKHVGRVAVAAEVEPRISLDDRWGLVAFAGAGRVAGTFGGLRDADTVFALGAGFRYHLARKLGLWAGIDVARSSDQDNGLYITVGTAWR